MKKFLFLALVILTMPTTILRAGEFYLGVQGGGNFLYSSFLKKQHCKLDSGYNVGIVGGYAWCQGWRLESEVTYRRNSYNLNGTNLNAEPDKFHGHVNSWSLMENGYYDFVGFSFWRITPYLGGGIGFDHVHQKIKMVGENFKGSNNGFGWQLMGGINSCLCEDIVISAEYKFHVSPLNEGHHLQNHSVTIALKKFFNFR